MDTTYETLALRVSDEISTHTHTYTHACVCHFNYLISENRYLVCITFCINASLDFWVSMGYSKNSAMEWQAVIRPRYLSLPVFFAQITYCALDYSLDLEIATPAPPPLPTPFFNIPKYTKHFFKCAHYCTGQIADLFISNVIVRDIPR